MTEGIVFPYVFEAPIEKFGVGKKKVIWYNVLIVPQDICAELPLSEYPRLRVEGEIADIPIANAFMPTGDGRHYVIVAPHVLKDSGANIGDVVEMRFQIADQNHVEVPTALARAIDASPATKLKWQSLTPGKKRMLAQHVFSAKTAPTKAKRIDEAICALLNHEADLRAQRNAARRQKQD
ncbi:MAG: YdeI/OmpD-associated family protein [Pseudomonadota bacterium]